MNGFMGSWGSRTSGPVRRLSSARWLMVGWIGAALSAAGCGDASIEPVRVANEEWGRLSIGVGPALNFSGSTAFDPNRVADLMASELSFVDRVDVIPLSRTLAVLAREGSTRIESPEHALDVARQLGADAMLLLAVTEYEPYELPVVGIAAQLYGVPRGRPRDRLDPTRVAREGSPASEFTGAGEFGLLAQSERVFDASHAAVAYRIKEYGRLRGADGSPFGWRRTIVSQTDYLRFCCHETLRALMEPDVEDVAAESPGSQERR